MTIQTVFDLPHTPECSRNGEGAFLRVGRDILFAYSEFPSADPGDDAVSNIALLRSSDEGESWCYEGCIAEAKRDFGVQNIMCVCPASLSDGSAAFFFLIKENDGNSTMGRAVSHDGGHTFHAERCIFAAEPAYYVLENDRVVRLSDGRLATALSRHDKDFTRANIVTILSQDDGKTFISAAEAGISGNCREDSTIEEPGVLERPDGSIWVWGRTYLGSQYYSVSHDGLKTLSDPLPSRFTSPRSPMIVKREKSGLCYAVYNPEPNRTGKHGLFDRTPLVLEISRDGGFTWGEKTEICSDREIAYMYPSVFETDDGSLLVSFMYETRSGTPNDDMRIIKIHF